MVVASSPVVDNGVDLGVDFRSKLLGCVCKLLFKNIFKGTIIIKRVH